MEDSKGINTKELNCKITKEVECIIEQLIENPLEVGNVDLLGKLVDIHKDIANEEYWKTKEEAIEMRYDYDRDNYRDDYRDNYGRRMRDSRGRYMESGRMGRRYRGEDIVDNMHEYYRDYSENRERMNMGNYGAKDGTMKSLEYMLQSVVDFIEMLKKDANPQDEVELIKEYTRHISEM